MWKTVRTPYDVRVSAPQIGVENDMIILEKYTEKSSFFLKKSTKTEILVFHKK